MLHPKVRVKLGKDEILGIVRLANTVFDKLEALPQITLAALNGVTRAGAAELTLACDMRIAAAHATWGVPEAKCGGFPGAGGPVRLAGIVGRARALEIICAARELNAAGDGALRAHAANHGGGGPAAGGARARRAHRRLRPARDPWRQAHRQHPRRVRVPRGARALDQLRYALEDTHDLKEGTSALLEGRAPKFTGK